MGCGSEATGANIENLGIERGHRTLVITRKGELIATNVAKLVSVPSGRSRKPKAWTSEEARTFLESARSDGDPLYALYVLVLVLGLRKGEVLGLAWEDVDLDGAS